MQSAKYINLDIISKFIKYSLKNVVVKAMFSLIVFEILLFKGWLALRPAQHVTGRKRVNEAHEVRGFFSRCFKALVIKNGTKVYFLS